MPRPRTPLAKAELTGAAANHPDRFRNGNRSEPESQGPLGHPPDYMTDAEKQAWDAFKVEWPWLAHEDRASVAALAKMRAMLEDPEHQKNAAFFTAYRVMLSEHGGTPVSRTKIYQAKDNDEGDEFDAFMILS